MKTALLVGLLCVCLTPALAGEAGDPFSDDPAEPLAVSEKSGSGQGTATLHEISFATVEGPMMQGDLLVPSGKGPFPAILYVHWLGDPETSNRTQFRQEAERMAERGVVGLLVDMPWSRPHWFRERKLVDDYDFSRRQVKNLRRALDVLTQRPEVDRKRIAYVGHDFGATYGSILLGVDSRINCAVLMAGTPILSDWFLLGSKIEGKSREAYMKKMAPLDPVNYVGKAKGVPILFQFATHDEYVAKDKAELFANSASAPKELRWYDAGHEMNAQAAADRVSWLEARLKLQKSKNGQLHSRK